jgi:hypothetical protein
VSLSANPDPSVVGQPVKFTATVSPLSSSLPMPTGTVDFYDTSTDTDLGTATVDVSGQVSLTTWDLGVGDNEITATYSGDDNYSGGVSPSGADLSARGQQAVAGYANDASSGTGSATIDQQVQQPNIITASTMANGVVSGTLDHSLNNTDGAYVPLDDGDADGNGTPALSVEGYGNDYRYQLLPITLHKDTALTGNVCTEWYSLEISGNLCAWSDGAKTAQVTAQNVFAANADTTLYVEGTAVGDGEISVDWIMAGNTISSADSLAVHVFNMEGPQAVPQLSTYTYSGDDGQAGSGEWLAPTGAQSYYTNPDTNEQTIDWGEGPSVGTVAYQASPNYSWSRNVYVVQVDVMPSTYSTPLAVVDGWPTQRNNTYCEAVKGGLEYEAHFGLVGPDGDKGVRQITVGFVQYVTFSDFNATYAGNQTLTSPLQGQTYLDKGDSVPATMPWCSTEPGAVFTADPSEDIPPVLEIDGADYGPDVGVPVTYQQYASLQAVVNAKLGHEQVNLAQESDVDFDLTLYVAAETTDIINGANEVCTGLYQANWRFDGSGNYAPVASQMAFGGVTWSEKPLISGVTRPVGWTATSGVAISYLGVTTAYQAGNSGTKWS